MRARLSASLGGRARVGCRTWPRSSRRTPLTSDTCIRQARSRAARSRSRSAGGSSTAPRASWCPDGASARVSSGLDKPLNGQQLTALREKAQELQKRLPDPGARTELADLRLRIGDSVRRNQNPVLSERVAVEISVARDAEPGARVIRLRTALGLSNPLVFVVGRIPEVREIENEDRPGRCGARRDPAGRRQRPHDPWR